MAVQEDALKKRTKEYALRVIKLVESLPRCATGDVLGKQLLRSGTSVGANYRSACRARSKLEFISKLGIAVEEADETIYWLELIVDGGLVKQELLSPLIKEGNELVAILSASHKTARMHIFHAQSAGTNLNRKSKIENRK